MNHFYIGVVVPSTIAVPIVVVLAKYKAVPREIKILFYYLLAMAVLYLVSGVLAHYGRNNLFLVHADTILESVFLLRFFYVVFTHSRVRKWIRLLLVAFPVYCCINFLFLQSLHSYNTYSRPVEAIIIMGLSMLYWWYTGDRAATGGWASAPLNWVISGLLLYFSSAFLLFVFSNFLMPGSNWALSALLWQIHATLILIMYLLFAIGFSKCHT